MKFSIIVPMFNTGPRLKTCLESILRQTYPEFEVIVVNDGSTDGNSRRIAKSFETKDSRIKVFDFNNSGVGVARRKGISLSVGDYILFVDSDDEIAPLLLEVLNNVITRYPNVDIIRHQCCLVNDASYKDPNRYNYKMSEQLLTGMEALKKWSIPHHKYAVYWLFTFKSSIFKDHDWHYPAIRCYEDLALIPLLIAAAKQVYVTSYVGYYQVQNNPTSITNSSHELELLKDFFTAYDFAITHFKKLEALSENDIEFLISDYKRRLIGKVDGLSGAVSSEFYSYQLAKRLKED